MQDFITDFKQIFWNKLNNNKYKKIIFLCVGTDRVIGDCFGPLVGEKLKILIGKKKEIEIIGDLEKAICINNIENVIKVIKDEFENPFIIGIDAALDKKELVGKIVISEQGLNAGSGLNKASFEIGEMSVKGIVSYNTGIPKQNFILLQNTSLGLVNEMASLTADGIYRAINV